MLLEKLNGIIESGLYQDYLDMAKGILATQQPDVALAALFQMAYKSDLDVNSYPEVRSFSVDRVGSSRLFIALGRRDGFTPRKLIDYICEKGTIRGRDIDDVAVLDEFSFITVPYQEATRLLDVFRSETVDGKPLVTKAKERN